MSDMDALQGESALPDPPQRQYAPDPHCPYCEDDGYIFHAAHPVTGEILVLRGKDESVGKYPAKLGPVACDNPFCRTYQRRVESGYFDEFYDDGGRKMRRQKFRDLERRFAYRKVTRREGMEAEYA